MDIEFVRRYCRSLPGVREDIKWGNDLCFLVGEKMFCVTSLEGPFTLTFKVPGDLFDELVAGSDFLPAPYLARAKWVSLARGASLKASDLERYIKQSYDLVRMKLPRKVLRQLENGGV